MQQTIAPAIITGQNIAAETFYNLCQLQKLTRYANPIAALRTTGQRFTVTRDASGNILTAKEVK